MGKQAGSHWSSGKRAFPVVFFFLSISDAHFEGGLICCKTLSLFLSQEGVSCMLNPRVDVDLFNSDSGIISDTFIRFNA